MEIFHVDSIKRDNGKVIGIAVIQAKSQSAIRLYFTAEHIFHQQNSNDPDKLLVPFIDSKTGKQTHFQIKAEQINDDFFIKEPDDSKQLDVFNSLQEYSYRPSDFL